MFVLFFFFFFKQKTSYELRISDWSSDVCSSDLLGARGVSGDRSRTDPARERATARDADPDRRGRRKRGRRTAAETERLDPARSRSAALGQIRKVQPPDQRNIGHQRSEEHTSELQSLMRISYAVFCLKTKKTRNEPNTTNKQII